MARLAGRNKAARRVLNLASTKTTGADLTTTSVANATDLATAMALVNDLKAKYNLNVALTNEIKADHNTLVTALQG